MKIFRFSLLIGMVEGLAVLMFLFASPSDTERVWLWGYSPLRWGLALWVSQGVFAFLIFLLMSWHRPEALARLGHFLNSWFLRSKGFSITVLCLLAGVASGCYFIYITYAITNAQVKGYFQRLEQIVAWVSLLCLQALLAIVLLYGKEHGLAFRRWFSQLGGKLTQNIEDIAAISLLLIVSVVLFWPVKYPTITSGTLAGWDYVVHTRFAERMAESRQAETSFFLYELLVIAAHLLQSAGNYLVQGKFVALLFDLMTALVVYVILRRSLRVIIPNRKWLKGSVCLGLALSVTLVAPVSVITWGSHNLLFGYIGINTTHNPTYLLLKPLALLLFLNTLEIFTPHSVSRVRFVLIALLTILTTLAKPNYIICLLPALSLMVLFWLIKKRPLDWQKLILGFIIPAVVVLGWQYLATYTADRVLRAEGGVIFAPLAVYLQDSGMLLPKFILSILFPLVVYALYFKNASADISFNLSWLVFIFGAFYTYMLAESGVRFQDGNFKWSGQITLFILFIASLVFFLRQNADWLSSPTGRKPDDAFVTCTVVFGLHLASGILFYTMQLTQPANPWW